MRFRLVPRNDQFFDFAAAGRNAADGMARLRDLAEDFTDIEAKF